MTEREMDELIERHDRAEEGGDPDAAVAHRADFIAREFAGAHRLTAKRDARPFYTGLFAALWQIDHSGGEWVSAARRGLRGRGGAAGNLNGFRLQAAV